MVSASSSHSTVGEALTQFFLAHGDAIVEIFGAWRCREGWVQGEIYRWMRRQDGIAFTVNLNELDNKLFDFAASTPTGISYGEIKVLGTGYQCKCVTGGALSYPDVVDGKIDRSKAERLQRGKWGLIPDYLRLLSAPPACERLLVLVADVVPESQDDLSAVLRRIDFEGDHSFIALPRGFVRIWSV